MYVPAMALPTAPPPPSSVVPVPVAVPPGVPVAPPLSPPVADAVEPPVVAPPLTEVEPPVAEVPPGGWSRVREAVYGGTRLTFLRPAGKPGPA